MSRFTIVLCTVLLISVFLAKEISSLKCYECDSTAGDASCLGDSLSTSWKTERCNETIEDLDFTIKPDRIRCIHLTYVEDDKRQVERKCGFEGLCELILGLNQLHILGNVTNIDCKTCSTPMCNLVADPRAVVFRNTNKL